MSPLWSDMALARAALAKAVERGVVDEQPAPEKSASEKKDPAWREAVRRLPLPRLASFAL
jgi:hypothetical protein